MTDDAPARRVPSKVEKDPRKRLEAVGETALDAMASMTDQALDVLWEGLDPEQKNILPYRERRAAAQYVLDYVRPSSPNRSPGDSLTIQLLNQDQQAMAVFIQKAGELERIPREMADVPSVDDDPHLIAPEKGSEEEDP